MSGKLYLSIIIVIIYLVLDAYSIAEANSLSFATAFLHHNLLTKGFVSLAILFLGILDFSKKESSNPRKEINESREFDIFQNVAKIISSPVPIPSQATQIAKTLKEELDIECSFIAEYLPNDVAVLTDHESLKSHGIKSRFTPHAENLVSGSLDEMVSLFFLEKREFEIKKIQTPAGSYDGYFCALKKNENTKPVGIFVILSKNNEDYTHIIKSLSALVAFSISLHQSKLASEKFQEQLMQKDDVLKIPTNTVLQTIIEQEFHRFLRYGTSLTLILIEIDHLKNLESIFDKDSILNLKKEFCTAISKNIRSTDIFGKWTENRFAIVAPSIDFRGGKNFASKLTKILSTQRFAKVGRVTCSYGVTSLGKDDTIAAFRKRAEDALNTAISKGGNAVDVKILI